MGFQSYIKQLKNRLFPATYSLRRVYTASEKSLKVAQEVRDITKELRGQNAELVSALKGLAELPLTTGGSRKSGGDSTPYPQVPIELQMLGRSAMRSIVESSHPYYLLVFFVRNKIILEWATDKRHVSMSIRQETSLKYLKDILESSPLNLLQQFFFIINLEDAPYDGPFAPFVWNFSGKTGVPGIVWPNNYAQSDFGGKLARSDELTWEKKRDNCCFYGSSTGSLDPSNNDRVQVCLLAHKKNSSLFTAKITDWVQISSQALLFEKADISSPYVSIEDQLKSKIILSVDGNATAWDRIAWVLNSNSLLFKYESDYYDWFYDKLQDEVHYIHIKKNDDLFDKISYYLKNAQTSKEIVKRANQLVQEELVYNKHLHFSRWTMENYEIKYFGER